MDIPGFAIITPTGHDLEEKHGFARDWAISPANSGFQAIRIGHGTIPPHCVTTPHWHTACETAIYIITGHVKINIGRRLSEHYQAGPGDFIYVGKGVIHQTITTDEPCEYIQIRDQATEDAIEYDPAADL
jgi:uncharacterized RmlC-like cupin family protein